MPTEPGVVSRDGTILYVPVITQEQRNALWAQIIRNAAPGLLKSENLHKEEPHEAKIL